MKGSERSLVIPITLGSMFEWFEVYLFSYWAPLMAKNIFDLSIPLSELIYAILILSTGFIARPLGGAIFGYIGDRWGRRTSFLISIVCITIPSIAIAFMPSFKAWAFSSMIYIGLMRFFQGIPAGGELPGALCLLAESAEPDRRRYLCSYLFVGPQIGQILSMLLCYQLQNHLTEQQLIEWGWRLSFGVAGIVGLIGFFFRRTLHESKAFNHLKTEHKIELHPLKESLTHQKKNIGIAFFISLFEVIGFFMIYFYLFQNATAILKINPAYSTIVYLAHLIFLTCIMPVYGKINTKYSSKSLLKLSAWGAIAVSLPFYFAIANSSIFWMFVSLNLLILFLCIQFSILPSFIADLFPTRSRFTCLGFSFNIATGVIGGIAPFVGNWLVLSTGKTASFALFFPVAALIFLIFLKWANPIIHKS